MRSVEGESTSHTQSGARSSQRPVGEGRQALASPGGEVGDDDRRSEVQARARSTIHQPPGPPLAVVEARPRACPWSPWAPACLRAGRGLRKSSPSRISATLFSGAFSTSSYVARFMVSGSAGVGLDQSIPPSDAAATFPAPAISHLRCDGSSHGDADGSGQSSPSDPAALAVRNRDTQLA